LNCSTDLIFDGAITGNINSKGSLTIGQNASVKGDLKAEKAIIEGKVAGNWGFQLLPTFPHFCYLWVGQHGQPADEEGASLEGQCKVGKAIA
jgi:hypothetical protein